MNHLALGTTEMFGEDEEWPRNHQRSYCASLQELFLKCQ